MTLIHVGEIQPKVISRGANKGKTMLRVHAKPGGWGAIFDEADVLFVQRKGSGDYEAVIERWENEDGSPNVQYKNLRQPSEDLIAEGVRKAEEYLQAEAQSGYHSEYEQRYQRDYIAERLSIERQKAADIAKDLAIVDHSAMATIDMFTAFTAYFEHVLAAIQDREIRRALAAIQGQESMGAERGNASWGTTDGASTQVKREVTAGQASQPPMAEQEQGNGDPVSPQSARAINGASVPAPARVRSTIVPHDAGSFFQWAIQEFGFRGPTPVLKALGLMASEELIGNYHDDWPRAQALLREAQKSE